ncbi:hypothetical protein E2C01_075786 [Portunus trituberculatus]|uniref:Uncharacterized protein n=1 Tax=Portunus trituberculatus TaxID=210409 RepID=A0A5B7I9H7_PORTR|nr:hypothetical protein [Portunus trituberculatus]
MQDSNPLPGPSRREFKAHVFGDMVVYVIFLSARTPYAHSGRTVTACYSVKPFACKRGATCGVTGEDVISELVSCVCVCVCVCVCWAD